jgi:hypothetical protein
MPGNLQIENIVSDPSPIVVSLTTTPQRFLSQKKTAGTSIAYAINAENT